MAYMRPEVKNWWLALADAYEDIAERPKFHRGIVDYSCLALDREEYDLRSGPCSDLGPLFTMVGYRNGSFPIGHTGDSTYPTRQEAFVQDLAEFIRENVQ